MQSIDLPRRNLAIAAASLAGFVDAVGFVSAGGYFVSFMSGNTTRLGVDLAGNPRQAIIPALLILGFVCGVFAGALLAAKSGNRRKAVILMTVALLLALAALAGQFDLNALRMAALVVAMGVLNNTFQRNGEVSVGLTYMTGALVRAAQGLAARLAGTGGDGWSNWLLLWTGLAVGAVCGAWIQIALPYLALWLAAGWAALLAYAARRLTLR